MFGKKKAIDEFKEIEKIEEIRYAGEIERLQPYAFWFSDSINKELLSIAEKGKSLPTILKVKYPFGDSKGNIGMYRELQVIVDPNMQELIKLE